MIVTDAFGIGKRRRGGVHKVKLFSLAKRSPASSSLPRHLTKWINMYWNVFNKLENSNCIAVNCVCNGLAKYLKILLLLCKSIAVFSSDIIFYYSKLLQLQLSSFYQLNNSAIFFLG